ncbi:MAG: transglycosylase SLT domain-containing protein [Parabacteroides sp.]
MACGSGHTGEAEQESVQPVDLPQLAERGEITAVTLYSSISYFQYKMQPMGYEYDLIRSFARSQGLKLEIKVAENATRLVEMLEAGEADVVAYPLPINHQLKERVLYCGHEAISSQVLVQRGGKRDSLLTDVTQLIGRTVHVKAGTRYAERLKNLDAELGGGIDIKYIEKDTVTTEDLIEMVSKGEIAYTVSDDNIARLNKTYYGNIQTDLKVSFQQRSSWMVRRSSPLLAEAIDQWASDNSGRRSFKAAMKRYFELSKRPTVVELPKITDGHISPYDDLFRKHAKNIGWDWQLLASVAYQESRFNTQVVSWAGAEGLMGIMPSTARALGVSPHELNDPDIGIRIGVECLHRFRQGFSRVEDPEEKIKFTLASYNAGIGHIYDAQRLAEKYGKDPLKWDNHVAEYVRLKSDPDYYNDPVCKHGYLRGSETFDYVSEVIRRYHYYKQQIKH